MKDTNWTAIIMTGLTVLVGLACAIIAFTLAKEDATAKGVLFGIAGAALGSFLKQPHKAGEGGGPTLPPATVLLLVGAGLLLSSPARAADCPSQLGCLDKANTYAVVPVTAVGWQLNLKDGGAANVVSLLGLAVQHTFGSVPLGLGLYAGLGASTENSSNYQFCAGLSITSWGMVCLGPQHARFASGSTAWQLMGTFAASLSFAGTPGHVVDAQTAAKASMVQPGDTLKVGDF